MKNEVNRALMAKKTILYTIKNFARRLVMLLAVGLIAVNVWGDALSLPHSWDASDGQNAYTTALGCTLSGLGSDYGSAPKLKFDTQGDNMIIQLADAPDKLGYNIKGNPGSGTATSGTFDVQESSNGSTYTSVRSYSNKDNTTTSESNIQLNSATRYIKFIYTTKSSGNIALGGISISKAAASSFTVTIAKNQASWGSVDKSSVTGVANNTSISASGNVLTVGATTVTATPHAQDANYNYAFSSWSGIPAGGKVTANVTVTANFTRTARELTNYRTSCVACEAPTSVTITGTNKYLGGQTISLTATPTGGTGTPSYQWQKKINSVWTDLTNGNGISGATTNNLQISSCGHGNSGGYRCIVSTGEGCETKSHADGTDGYGVHVFSLNGGYSGGDWSAHDITWTSGTTGTATIHLNASSTYMFKVFSNNGLYYGNGENNYIIQPITWDCGTGNHDMRLFTGPEGDYTFTVNIEHGLDNSPYVNVQVGYPAVSHPSTGYIYISKWWDCYVHYWEGTNNDLTTWGSDPKIDNDRYATICGNNYWYFPVIATYNKFIAKDNAGNPSNTTGDQVTTSHGGMYITHDGNAWVWRDFSTFTITYAGGAGSTGGPMAPNTGICPGSSQQLTANAFSKAYHTFDGWSDGNGHTYADQATITNIQNDIDLTAQWTPEQYDITATLTNVTSTTSFPVAYSYTGSAASLTYTFAAASGYCLPNSVTVSGSTYTWDKASGVLTLTGVITSNVSISVTAVQAYTVTFVHHDKGTYSGGSTEWIVPANDNITLPTVTDVSCGFYDTFEGWIASGSEYSESTSKPATVYAGGSSYTVSGDVTLRALYSKCEGDGGQVYRKVTSTAAVTNGTYILVSSTATPRVYSGHEGSNTYGSSISGLTADGDDYSSTLPSGAVQTTITVGTGVNAGKFAIYNGSKYLNYTGGNNLHTADAITYLWKLTDGSNVNNKSCPAGVLCPDGYATRVLQCNTSSSNRFACYENSQSNHVFIYQLIDKCTKSYATNPSCVKPVGVHVRYNANTDDASLSMSCSGNDWTYKVEDAVNKYPKLASSHSFCTNATRDEYTLIGWNTQANGLGTTYEITHSYSSLPVSGELDGENWVTLNLFAMWASAVSFNLGNATGGTGVPAVVEEDGGFMLPEPTAAQIGTIPCGYSFYGWSESSVSSTPTKPALIMPGTKYTGSARTLYAVYRLAGEGGGDLYYFTFEYNSKTYCITRKHASYDRFVVEETTSGLEFGLEDGYLYYMDNDAKTYVYWAGSSTTVTTTSTKPNNNSYKTSFVAGANGTTVVTPATSERYLQMPESYTDRAYYTTSEVNPTLVEATSYTYATNPSCETTATLQFVINGGGTLNYPDGYSSSNYEDLTVGTTVYLPTATFAGEWVFEGWMKGSPLPSQDYSPEGMSNFYTVTLNTTTYEATPAGTTTFYAVFSKTNNDKQFDPVNGGTYKIFGIKSDATKVYMPVWGGGTSTVAGVTDCELTGEYTITPGTGDYAGQYKITHVNGNNTYTLGVEGDGSGQTGLKNVADAWWDIEASSSTKGTWRMKIHGSSNRVLSLSSNTFGNYAVSQVNNPSQTTYRDMEIGECIYTEYTSTPENIPYITITGSPVKITSTKGERVYAPTKIHIEAHNFSTTRTIHFSATNGFAADPASVNTGANGAYSGDIDIYYQPTTDGDGSIVTSVLTASQVAGPAAEHVSQTFSAIKGRNLPQDFVIAVKSGEQWYALPDDCHSSGTPKAVPIEVNDPSAPTAASLVPHNVEWRLHQVVGAQSSGSRPKDKIYFYEPNSNNNYALYAGSAPNIQTNAQLSNISGTNSYRYEWGLTTSDLCAYTIDNVNVGRNISINSAGNFGTHAASIISSTLYLLPITAYYEPAAMQVLEWKANSVVVMYTGTQTTATTTVGDNSASGTQTLASQKLTHGIYELTTGQALTANAGATLKISFGGGAEIIYVNIPIIINSAVTASESHESQDVVIVSGGKLTAAATKYSYHNIYVYGGGKLKIGSGSQLGVNNIIMRAGGITTNGTGGSATYAYTYPQVELGGTLTSTQANIKYECITDYDHWYQFCLPFNGTLSTITYPQEYYGDNVTAANTGSWVIKRYAGEVRATGSYDAWVDIETEEATSVTAGHGYLFWGAPKKVTIGGDKQRQLWGIQRITMPIAAAAATTAETNDKNISVDSYSEEATSTKPNDQGWNLVGNPYMVNLTGLSSESLIAGELVHSNTNPWDGKWINDGTGTRYVTIPDNHFDNYEAHTMSWFTADNPMVNGRVFFVQIAEGATTLTFAATNRASLMPALFATTKATDIETGIVMSDETHKDEVNFWIKEGKTADYEFNADYPKTPNATNFNIYGVHSQGDLSWVAVGPEIAESPMAIGYQVPDAGDYTLSLSEIYTSEEIDHLFVTDHETSPEITTDLMDQDYVFHVNQAETNNIRFTVSIMLKDEDTGTTTGIDNLDVNSDVPTKFIYQDKMYILYQGIIYDATGKRVSIIKR